MTRFFVALFFLSLAACTRDETLTGHGAAARLWNLTEINQNPFAAPVSLFMEEGGFVQGVGPCNSFEGRVNSPYPWFSLNNLKRGTQECPDYDAETYALQLLLRMNEAEVLDKTLILRGDDTAEMVFTAAE
ncbi:META domain-containing protein [Epibacterium ulvae]|uniref:META domain-containing protein n=1 Tax=Epibacterium ulvae TaxID=1156985 RepID=UPI00248FB9DA|nr:META domain-containing protein [Epibacterium ulvae]